MVGTAVQAGQCPPDEDDALSNLAQQAQWEMRRVVAVMSGNFDYWGLREEALSSTKKLRGKRLELVQPWLGFSRDTARMEIDDLMTFDQRSINAGFSQESVSTGKSHRVFAEDWDAGLRKDRAQAAGRWEAPHDGPVAPVRS